MEVFYYRMPSVEGFEAVTTDGFYLITGKKAQLFEAKTNLVDAIDSLYNKETNDWNNFITAIDTYGIEGLENNVVVF